jgi:hypothetical protein
MALKHDENKTGLFALTEEQRLSACRQGGRVAGPINGLKNVLSGHIKRINQLPQTKAAKSELGRKHAANKTGVCGRSKDQIRLDGQQGGNKAHENRIGVFAPENLGKGAHNLWHTNRGIKNPNCRFCQAA